MRDGIPKKENGSNNNLAVKRNIDRFPSDFMFQLTKEEFDNLRFQFETSGEIKIFKESQKNRMNNNINYNKEEIEKIVRVLKSDILSSRFGNITREFEKEFARKFKVKYAIAMNSGTSTLHSALIACGVNPEDEVIISAISVICVANAVVNANCVPVFADVNKQTFNIEPEDIERKITKKTKVIIPVSMFGLSPEMDKIMKIASKYKLKVIEDSAMNFLGYYKNKLSGTIGDFGSFSFEQTKHLSTGEGGMLITDNERLAIRARQFANNGYKFMDGYGRIKNKPAMFEYIGNNYRITEISAIIGLIKLGKLDKLVENRIEYANMYKKIMGKLSIFNLQVVPEYIKHSYYRFACLFNGNEKNKKKFLEYINRKINIASVWFRQIYLEPSLKNFANNTRCNISDKIGDSILTFRTDFNTEKEGEMAFDSLKKAIKIL